MRRNHARGCKLLNRLFCLLLCVSFMTPGLSAPEEIPGEPEGVVWCEHEEHAASGDELFVFESPESAAPADVPACTHESVERIAGERGNESDWRYETENHHVRTFERTYRMVCLTCGALLEEETACESEWAEHRFGADGACLDCKWRPAPLETPAAQPVEVAAPAPKAADTPEPAEDPNVAPIGEPEPTAASATEPTADPDGEATLAPEVTADTTTNPEEVPEANVMLLAVFSDESDAEEASDEKCDNSEHLHSEFVTKEYSAWEKKNKYLNAHVRICYEVHGYYCMECDKTYYTETYENEQRGEHCLNTEGVCTVCGWDETSCPHTNTYLFTTGENFAYTQLDEVQHLWTYDSICYTWCSDCDAKLDEGVLVETKQIIQDHVPYSWSGTCQLCGYSQNCDHADAVSNERIYKGDYEYINSTHHRVKGSLRELSYCSKCGARKWGDVIEENTTKLEKHNWSGGTCSSCGAVNECRHENISTTEDRGNGKYEYIDESRHRVTYVVIERKECLDCGYVLSSSVPTGKNTVEENHYFTNGVCKCGYVNECKHETTTERWYGGVSGNYRYTILDETQHETSYIPVIATVCTKCWSALKKENGERYTFAQDHSFEGSFCSRCGFNNCQHENTKVETYNGQSQYVYENDDQHSLVYDTYEITTCADCGEELIRVSVEPIKETSRHTYDKTGVCTGCGGFCPHGNTTVTNEIGDLLNCESINDEQHNSVYENIEITTCKDCGEELSRVSAETVKEIGRHFYVLNLQSKCNGQKK